ncbi:MAG: hypothetical protein ACJASL_000134 [Paraglaciecola sp.]|jgi:hypothetical protein
MSRHVIKFEYDNGVKLDRPTLWCKKDYNPHQFVFNDAQHVALSVGGSIQPCKNCIKAIIKELSKEL